MQYSIADRFLPNLSMSGPVMGVVTAPVTNPNAYRLATLNPYDSYKTYKCVPWSPSANIITKRTERYFKRRIVNDENEEEEDDDDDGDDERITSVF
mmetsp:Transcript_35499/g.39890  ORF Transcript_35499/g.39890 Transcript_35499/m.39890 type:complete len:96 (+) Transcript_35499:1657-1944(+)